MKDKIDMDYGKVETDTLIAFLKDAPRVNQQTAVTYLAAKLGLLTDPISRCALMAEMFQIDVTDIVEELKLKAIKDRM